MWASASFYTKEISTDDDSDGNSIKSWCKN